MQLPLSAPPRLPSAVVVSEAAQFSPERHHLSRAEQQGQSAAIGTHHAEHKLGAFAGLDHGPEGEDEEGDDV